MVGLGVQSANRFDKLRATDEFSLMLHERSCSRFPPSAQGNCHYPSAVDHVAAPHCGRLSYHIIVRVHVLQNYMQVQCQVCTEARFILAAQDAG